MTRGPIAAALITLAALAAGAQSGGTDAVSLTVDQAVARALANQPMILQAQASLEAARARVGEAQSAYWPGISASGAYTHIEPDQSVSVTLGSLGTISLVVPTDNYDVHLGLNQVITQFGRRDAQVKLAESGATSARIGVEQVKTAVGYQAAQVFFTALFLQQQTAALGAQYDNLQQHLRVIEIREQTGSATRLEILSTQVRMASLQGQGVDAQTQLRKQLVALGQLTGLAGGEIQLAGDFTPGADTAESASLVASALEKRTEVRQAVEAQRAAELSVKVAFDAQYPTLSARGAAGWRNGLEPSPKSLTFNWSAGVQLSVPVFQGFLWARSVDEARSRVDASKAAAQAARISVTTQVLQAWQDVQGAREQVAITASALDQAKQMVDVAKVQYDIGVITNLEYLDAQTALETSNITNLGALYKEVLSEYALRQAAGGTLAQ